MVASLKEASSDRMNRLPALAWVLAATIMSPAVARTVNIPPPATAAADISGAASIAAGYGVVTSTYRSVAHNRAVGGVANSYHLSGRAIDVARKSGVTHGQIAAALQRAGYAMVESLDEGDHSHFAFATTRTLPITPILVIAKAAKPTPPAPSPLLADEHGALLIDLAAGGQQQAKVGLPATSSARIPAGTAARD